MIQAEVCAALREVVPRLVALLRGVPDAGAVSVGSWTVGEVAAHLCHAFRFDLDALAGGPVPDALVTAAGMAELNARLLAADGERDPAVLADRLGALAEEFDAVASRPAVDPVRWLDGVRLPPAVVAGHLLEECLVHGHDIATATGRPWPVRREHALLAVQRGAIPLIAALPPTAFVDQERAGSYRARFELRLRGGGRTVLAFDGGTLRIDPAGTGDIDAYVSAEPTALMLVFIGRQDLWKPILGGQLLAWGRRPWLLARMFTVLSPP
jgi:hypothetical protein